MRITNTVMIQNMMKNLRNNNDRLNKFNEQLSTGKRFQVPSEDPIGAVTSMDLNGLLSDNEQYVRNINESRDWLSYSESALKKAGDLLQRSRELAVYGSNESLEVPEKAAIADEIGQLREELINVANSKLNDRYLFGGNRTTARPGESYKPFEEISGQANINFAGNNAVIQREIGPDTTMEVNVNGKEVFQDAIDTLKALDLALRSENGQGPFEVGNISIDSVNDSLDKMDNIINTNLKARAEIGAKVNRLDLTINRMEDDKLHTTELLSKNEDIDIAKTITDFKMQESVYRASLAVSARIIQPTLIDFLR